MRKISPFKSLQRIHTAMLSGMVLFCIVSAIVHLQVLAAYNGNLNKVLQVIILAVSFILIKTGLSVFTKRWQSIPADTPAAKKIMLYKTAAIIKWAMMEVPVLLSVISFMLTRNYAFMVLAFVLMVVFALQGPVRQNILSQLQIREEEARQLEQVQNN